MRNFAQFQFDPAALAAPRKPGISGYMRIKNEAQFVRLCIESHLPFYDEIIAVYNDCTDDTPDILHELAAQHSKIKVFHYEPKVHPVCTEAHRNEPTESVHSMANYSNYALSKCNYSVATKLDADHLAIPCNLAPTIETIRADIAAGRRKFYFFSGINLIQAHGEIMVGGIAEYPFAGNGDHFYHQVAPAICFRQGREYEEFIKPHRNKIPRVHLGQLFFHLHHLKHGREVLFGEMQDGVYHDQSGSHIAIPFDEFCSVRNFRRMVGLMRRFRHQMRTHFFRFTAVYKLLHRLIGYQPQQLDVARLLRLADDLRGIDFQRDALDWLK